MGMRLGPLATGACALVLVTGATPVGAEPDRPAAGGATRVRATAMPAGAQSAPADGPITLGEVGNGSVSCFWSVPFGVTLEIENPARPSYVAPVTGVLTSYSTFANATAGNVRLLVLKAGADVTRRVLAAKSAEHAVVPSTLNTVPVWIPIQAGERIGLGVDASAMSCSIITSAADSSRVAELFDPDTTTDFVYTQTPAMSRPNVSAVLLPAPDTTLTRKPRQTPGKLRIVIRFTSVPGATFMCEVDGKAAKRPCKSPFKKHLKVGKHVVRITATSPYGVVETKPAKVKFTIRKP